MNYKIDTWGERQIGPLLYALALGPVDGGSGRQTLNKLKPFTMQEVQKTNTPRGSRGMQKRRSTKEIKYIYKIYI